MQQGSNEHKTSYIKTKSQFLTCCYIIIGLALFQYIWNSDSPRTPRFIKRYSSSLAISLIKNLPSRYLTTGRSGLKQDKNHLLMWRNRYSHQLRLICKKYKLDPKLVEILISVESGFRYDAISPRGAIGLMQVLPITALEMGISNPFDPIENMQAGCRYLHLMIDRYQGDLALALAAYNAGPGAVDKYGGIPPYAETKAYVKKILTAYRSIKKV
jgi:soluble lytic murein transglycosylase-like protein